MRDFHTSGRPPGGLLSFHGCGQLRLFSSRFVIYDRGKEVYSIEEMNLQKGFR